MKDKITRRNRTFVSMLIGIAIVLMMLGISTANTERVTDSHQIRNDIIQKSVNMVGGVVTTDLNAGITPTDLVNNLLGGGVTVSNVQFKGANISAGKFSGGTGIVGFGSGIILSSGDIKNVVGPNIEDGITASNSKPGDSDLNTLVTGGGTQDASVLEFDFIPATN